MRACVPGGPAQSSRGSDGQLVTQRALPVVEMVGTAAGEQTGDLAERQNCVVCPPRPWLAQRTKTSTALTALTREEARPGFPHSCPPPYRHSSQTLRQQERPTALRMRHHQPTFVVLQRSHHRMRVRQSHGDMHQPPTRLRSLTPRVGMRALREEQLRPRPAAQGLPDGFARRAAPCRAPEAWQAPPAHCRRQPQSRRRSSGSHDPAEHRPSASRSPFRCRHPHQQRGVRGVRAAVQSRKVVHQQRSPQGLFWDFQPPQPARA